MSSERIERKARELGGHGIYRLLFRYSVPTTVGFFVFSIYNTVDRMFIGRYGGSDALAGVSVTFPIFMIAIAIGMLIGVGGGALTSLRLGQKKYASAEQILGNVFALFLTAGCVLTVLGQVFLDPLLTFFGASGTVIPYARVYMRVLMSVITLDFMAMGLNAMIQAEGNPALSMVILSAGAVINAACDYVLIVRLGMGVRGAALATAFAKLISAVWILLHFTRGPRRVLTLRLRNLRFHPALTRSLLYIGLSPFTMQFINSFFITVTNRFLLKSGGDVAIGALGIIHSIVMLMMMPIIGLTRGAQPIIGFNYGARNYARVLKALKASLLLAALIGLAGAVLVQFFSPLLVRIFTRDPALIETAVTGMRLMLLLFPFGAFQMICANYFQTTARPLLSIGLHLLRLVVLYLPLIVIFSSRWGLPGIWLTTPVCDLLSGLASGALIVREARKLRA
ncbi:MAG: MATE family efflux transporter [PVC group bacterium]